MLFLTYWELNENMSEQARTQIVQKLMSTGLYPPKGFKILRFDVTPDAWGIVVAEADSAADVMLANNLWRMAGAGFFKCTKTAPAMPIEEAMQAAGPVLKALSEG